MPELNYIPAEYEAVIMRLQPWHAENFDLHQGALVVPKQTYYSISVPFGTN